MKPLLRTGFQGYIYAKRAGKSGIYLLMIPTLRMMILNPLWKTLYVKEEVHDVAVLNDIFLSFYTQLTCRTTCSL